MKHVFFIKLLLIICGQVIAQQNSKSDFVWGNVAYYNLSQGESIVYNLVDIKLLDVHNQCNTFKVANDTITVKVNKRSLPVSAKGIRIIVADNKNVKALNSNKGVHGLLNKDVLLGVSNLSSKMLDRQKYVFPISFNDGFLWSAEENSYMFSYYETSKNGKNECRLYEGIGIDLHDARGIEKHWIVALENSTVVWIEDKNIGEMGNEACVLLKSESNPNIFYLYNHLYNKNIEVRKGQRLIKGELIGTAWGDDKWGHLQMLVIKSDSVPAYENRFDNSLNFFPQLYELYFQESYSFPKSFTRGKIEFGRSAEYSRNQVNNTTFEEYMGKGWMLGEWSKTEKVPAVSKGEEGNVRLTKTIFSGEKGESKNPKTYFDYEINVLNGVYRIRAKVGDLNRPSWQKVDFEGITASTFALAAGEQKWTNERVVKVVDRKLTVRIHLDTKTSKVAGISEIVFQKAY